MTLTLGRLLTEMTGAIRSLEVQVSELRGPGKKTGTDEPGLLKKPAAEIAKDIRKIHQRLGFYAHKDFDFIEQRLDQFYRQRRFVTFRDFNANNGLDKFVRESRNTAKVIQYLIKNAEIESSFKRLTSNLNSRLFTLVFGYKLNDKRLEDIPDEPLARKITAKLNQVFDASAITKAYGDITELIMLVQKFLDEGADEMDLDHLLFNSTLERINKEIDEQNLEVRDIKAIATKYIVMLEDIHNHYLMNSGDIIAANNNSLEGKALDSATILEFLDEYLSENELEGNGLGAEGALLEEFPAYIGSYGKGTKKLFSILHDPAETKSILQQLVRNSENELRSSSHQNFVTVGVDEEDEDDFELNDTDAIIAHIVPRIYALVTNMPMPDVQDDLSIKTIIAEIRDDQNERELVEAKALNFLGNEPTQASWKDLQMNLRRSIIYLLDRSLVINDNKEIEFDEAWLKALAKFMSKYHEKNLVLGRKAQ